uniref:Uncharacterized protein n=1 Tax=Plectus sambesii TaxID=2011161 RepID=A0A914VJH3_9BILA
MCSNREESSGGRRWLVCAGGSIKSSAAAAAVPPVAALSTATTLTGESVIADASGQPDAALFHKRRRTKSCQSAGRRRQLRLRRLARSLFARLLINRLLVVDDPPALPHRPSTERRPDRDETLSARPEIAVCVLSNVVDWPRATVAEQRDGVVSVRPCRCYGGRAGPRGGQDYEQRVAVVCRTCRHEALLDVRCRAALAGVQRARPQ